MTTETKPPNLIQKLASVMAAVDSVPKNGRNEFHRYDYATEADIDRAVRRAMANAGVMLIPDVTKLEWREVETKSGKERIATLHVCYTITDGNEERRFTVIGEGQDRGDKATYKAMTGAGKYALLKLFLIPTGDDPENETEAPAPKAKPQAPKPDLATRKAAVVKELQGYGFEMQGVKLWVKEVLGQDKATTAEDCDKLDAALVLLRAEKNKDRDADLTY